MDRGARLDCLLVDDHAMFVEALALLVSIRHPEVALETAGHLAGALRRLACPPLPALVLLDLNLPDSRGTGTLAAVREAAPRVRVIVLSADDRPETVVAALDAGAAGFIPKSGDAAMLGAALRQVLAGGVFVPPGALAHAPSAAPASPELTARQRDVFRCLVAGLSNKLIARELTLSDSTVKTHVQAIYDKLGVASRAQAVLLAARMGWLDDPAG